MTADHASLEARVAELEQQMRHILPAKIDALNFGISVLHEDVRALRDEAERRLERVETHLDGMDGRLDSHGEMLQEILRRLPG
jgi:outer membrane murein-binding lipoprotein Lpp